MLEREQEAVVAVNGDLQHELDMYKSVMVPTDQKPRTNITRVGRLPLVNMTRSLNAGTGAQVDESVEKKGAQRMHILETIPGDMTIEEIL